MLELMVKRIWFNAFMMVCACAFGLAAALQLVEMCR